MKKQKLELTWIGKGARPKLGPCILLEDPAKSYHARHLVAENDRMSAKQEAGWVEATKQPTKDAQ